jgi:hypothetical protein
MLTLCQVFADGSKDLYPGPPATPAGYRSYLMTTSSAAAAFNPYPNAGIHKVYVKKDETIYAGSSMVGLTYSGTTGSVAIYNLAGNRVAFSGTSGTTTGRILTRAEELAGPDRTGITAGYTPLTYVAPADGIYEVRFTGTGAGTNILEPASPDTDKYKYAASATSWEQFTSQGNPATGTSLILAWDVSVGNAATGVLTAGRVYATTVNLTGPNSLFLNKSFYGKFYITTPQGFVYEVDNNGQNGASFNFFSNNKGAVMTESNFTSASLYKSLNTTTIADLNKRIWNPYNQDDVNNVTNKIFYKTPDLANFPTSASVFYSGSTQLTTTGTTLTGTESSTWLKGSPVIPEATNLVIDCQGGIAFRSNTQGNYEILIDVDGNNSYDNEEDVILRGASVIGLNTVQWNGKNGKNQTVNLANISLKVRATVAEVHFPFLDVESNYGGVIITRLDANMSKLASEDIVFWNDSDINHTSGTSTENANAMGGKSTPLYTYDGIRSSSNGHIWSTDEDNTNTKDANFFGQNKTLDTWTFVYGEAIGTVKFGSCISISGSVWNDSDGNSLKAGTELSVSGDNTSSSTTVDAGSTLYAYLTNSEGYIIQKSAVSATGTYSFDKAPAEKSGLRIVLTTENTTFGNKLAVPAPPTGWTFISENVGTNTTAQTGSGDGVINITTALSGNIINQNFGIQRPPVANSATYTLTDKPLSGQTIPLNGTFNASAGTSNKVSPLSGSDADATGTAPFFFIITSLPNSSGATAVGGEPELYYGDVLVTQTDIDNGTKYSDPSLFKIQLNGSKYEGITFGFKTVDAAGTNSPLATYSLNWSSPLPVTLISFKATTEENSIVDLTWGTAQESNADHFLIERSANAKSWHMIARKDAKGDSDAATSYQIQDPTPLTGISYYRLKMVDHDGTFTYSSLVRVKIAEAITATPSVYPNPAIDFIHLNGVNLGSIRRINRRWNKPHRSETGKLYCQD